MADNVELTKGQLLEQQSQEESIAFSAYRKSYALRVPPPKRPSTLNLSNLGFEFWMYLFMASASIALAAMRTWEAFYWVGYNTTQNEFYATVEAWLAVLVVEVGIVVFAAALARKRYMKREAERQAEQEGQGKKFRHSKDVEANNLMLVIGLLLMVVISMNAGLYQSIHIIQNISEQFVETLSYVLGISIGLGVSIIAFIGGEIIGQQVAIVTADFQDRAWDYEDELDRYQEDLESSWNRSDERRVIRSEVRQAAKSQGSVGFGYGSVTNNHRTSGGDLRRPPKQTERVFQYMDAVYEKEQRVPPFSEVMDALGTAKATTSEARTKWLDERGLSED